MQRHALLVPVWMQPGEDNHEIALEFCMQNMYYHGYPDPKPEDVGEYYSG